MFFILAIIALVLFLMPRYREPRVLKGYLSEDECAYIMKKAESEFQVSTVSENRTVDTSIRKSETAWLDIKDPILKNIVDRCLAHTDRPIINCESLQVVRYKPGGFYNPHYDACCTGDCGKVNQRMHTFLFVLKDDFEGGETRFPTIDKSYKLKAGDILFFDNLDSYGLCTPRSLHGGQPVKAGTKWICNLWVHTYKIE